MQRRTWGFVLGLLMLAAPLAAALAGVDATQASPAAPAAPAKDEERSPLQPGPDVPGVTSSRYLDQDRNRIFDTLDAILAAKSDRDAVPVVVVLNTPPTDLEMSLLQQQLGVFTVTSNKDQPWDAEGKPWDVIPGFSATLTKAQIRELSLRPDVMQVEYDKELRAALGSASQYAGVDKARADFGVTGDLDNSLKGYSTKDIVACVVDTGIDAGHVDLNEGQVIGWKDYVNGRTGPYDDNGHGSHVSGILAGQGDGNSANRGVASGTALVGVKVLDAQGSGSLTNVVNGINFCKNNINTYAIDILSMSLGASGCSDGTESDSQAANNAWNAGLVVVIAAGNSGPGYCTIGDPGSAANVITVGAMADPGQAGAGSGLPPGGWYLAYFSSRGKTADGRVKPDVAAPGVAIVSVKAGSGNGYTSMSGTSMATPFVAGVASLMLSANLNLKNSDIKSKLTGTAQDWRVDTAYDYDYGAGRLQAYDAVKSAGGFSGTGPANPAHFGKSDSLAGTNAYDTYSLSVQGTNYRISLTLIIPGASGSKDFDLYLYNPSGSQVAVSDGTTRQETISYAPTATGTYTVKVLSYTGSGSYWLDASANASGMSLAHNG